MYKPSAKLTRDFKYRDVYAYITGVDVDAVFLKKGEIVRIRIEDNKLLAETENEFQFYAEPDDIEFIPDPDFGFFTIFDLDENDYLFEDSSEYGYNLSSWSSLKECISWIKENGHCERYEIRNSMEEVLYTTEKDNE